MGATFDAYYDAWYLLGIFAVAAVAGIVSTFSDNRGLSLWHVLAAGSIGGFVAVAVVSLLVGDSGWVNYSERRSLGIAILVGLTGKASLKVAYFALNRIAKHIGMETLNDDRVDITDED